MGIQIYWAVYLPAVALALASATLTLAAARAVLRLAGSPTPSGPSLPASVLRPLHGATPGLGACLAAARDQVHAAPFEVFAIVRHAADPGAAVARYVLGAVAVEPALHGPNRKASQLHNLVGHATHAIVVAADDDILPPRHWLTAVTAPLADPAVGLVTCLYRGAPADGGLWSRLAALAIDWQFLPYAALGESLGRAQGCYGATVALRRETLDRIGGFAALAGLLADDHAIGAAVRRLGLRVVVAPVIPRHVMTEPSFAALFRHELRWARTIRMLDPAGAFGAVLTFPLAWGLLAALLAPAWWGLGVLMITCAARLILVLAVDRALAEPAQAPAGAPPPFSDFAGGTASRLLLLPLRDLLSGLVWLIGLARGSVTWQGRRYRMTGDGAMMEIGRTRCR